jgi:hypothetical protein
MNSSRLGRVAIWITVAVAGLIAITTVALQTAAFHRFILARVMQKVETLTGARVQIGAFAFRWRGLRVDFYNVVLRGTEQVSERPLLATDHLAISMKILSAWKKQIDLSEIILDRPIASLEIIYPLRRLELEKPKKEATSSIWPFSISSSVPERFITTIDKCPFPPTCMICIPKVCSTI